jgi:hypothetical protein
MPCSLVRREKCSDIADDVKIMISLGDFNLLDTYLWISFFLMDVIVCTG